MATHSSILAWKIPWTEEPGGYSPWDLKELDTTERLNTCKAWLGHVQNNFNHLVVPESEEVLKQNDMGVSQGHTSLQKENSKTKDDVTYGSK